MESHPQSNSSHEFPPSPEQTPTNTPRKRARIGDAEREAGSPPATATGFSFSQRELRSRTASTGSAPTEATSRSEPTRADTPSTRTASVSSATGHERKSNRTRTNVQRAPVSAPAEIPQTQKNPQASPSRPDPPTKAHSAPAQAPRSSKASSVDDAIISALKSPLSKPQASSKEYGNNYVLEVKTSSTESKKLTKVGFTKGEGKQRFNKIRKLCRPLSIEQQDDPEHIPIRLYKKAEGLIKAELAAFLHEFSCECQVQHREYFDIEIRVAREVTQRWRKFCRKEPYDDNGNLQPFWEHRIRTMRAPSKSEKPCDHHMRAERWERFMSPTLFEVISYDATSPIITLWRWRWHFITWIQSFVVAFLTSPARWGLLLFGLLTGCILVEMGGVHRPHTLNVLIRKLRETGIARVISPEEGDDAKDFSDTAEEPVQEPSMVQVQREDVETETPRI